MERIRNAGNSDLLVSLVKRVGEGRSVTVDNPSEVSMVPDTMIGFAYATEPVKTTVSVRNVGDLMNTSCYVGVVFIASNCCNDWRLSVLDLSQFVNLRELKVGDECFENVNEVKLIGLSQLERVVIGMNCFTKRKNSWKNDPNRHFYLKDCERMRELKIGCYSFSDYTVCEIENVPSLEVIEMGELNEVSYNFCYASELKLKSDCERMK